MNELKRPVSPLRKGILISSIILLILAVGAGALWFWRVPVEAFVMRFVPHASVAVKPAPQPRPTPKTQPAPQPYVPDFTLPTASDGVAPVVTHVDTKQPVVFLGIDDGAYKDPSVVQLMKENHIKASLFLSKEFIADNPGFFKQLINEGSLVEDHTLSHDIKMTSEQSYDQQKAEICGMADYEQQEYGRRPILFRPPGGLYSSTMLRAANDCGMKAVVDWVAKSNGGAMQYQVGDKLRPGDVVLMHFRPSFKQDMQAFVDAEKAAGLHTELIESAVK